MAGTPFQRDLTNAFARLEKMLSPRMRQFLDRLPSVLAAKPRPARRRGGDRPPTWSARLLEATLHFRVATMRYHSVSSGRDKDYLVHPYRLVVRAGRALSAGLCPGVQGRADVCRRPDRVGVAREADVHAEASAIGDDVFANSLGVNTGRPRGSRSSSSRASPRYVRARVWHPSQQIRDADDGRVVLSMDVCHDWALRSWILGWGPLARVVSPASLANEIRADLDCRRRTLQLIRDRYRHAT